MRRAAVLAALSLAAATLAACGGNSDATGLGTRTQTATRTTRTTTAPVLLPRSTHDGCRPVAAPVPRPGSVSRPRRKLRKGRRYVVSVRTNCGTFQISLDVSEFPKTARSFAGLARSGFYDRLTFHRISNPGGKDFVIQGGDPLGTGNGGPGFEVVEKPPADTTYPRLTVAMAKTQDEKPGTSGSQFFIVTGSGAGLQPVYAKIGRVIHGGAAVRRIAAVPADPVTEQPLDAVVITKMTLSSSR